MYPADASIPPIASGNGVHRVEYRYVDDSKCPCRPAWTDLLTENPHLVGLHRRVVDCVGIERNLIPVKEPGQRVFNGKPDKLKDTDFSFSIFNYNLILLIF